MNYGGHSLAATGLGLTIGGVFFDQMALVGISLGLIVAGAMVVRYGFRRGKNVGDV